VPAAIISMIVVGIGTIFVFVNTFGDVIYQSINYANNSSIGLSTVISSIMSICVLVIFMLVMFGPTIYNKWKSKTHKHNAK
jgi:uncharacterized membrane protein